MRLILIFWPLFYSWTRLKDGAFILKVSAPFDVSSDHLSLLKEVELFRARALQF